MSPNVVNRPLAEADVPAVSLLHAKVFGPGRFARTAYRVREGTAAISPYCRGALLGDKLIAAVRFTPITIGGTGGALLLGPLVVDSGFTGQGFGRRLIDEAMKAAQTAGEKLVLLVGDEPYYGRFGFAAVPPGQIALPGPVDPRRLLAAELQSGALATFKGLVAAQR